MLGKPNDESGMVTAEFAVALPAVAVILALILGGISIGWARTQACQLAGIYARAHAVGTSVPKDVGALPHRVSVQADELFVSARVEVEVPAWGSVDCQISAWKELSDLP